VCITLSSSSSSGSCISYVVVCYLLLSVLKISDVIIIY